MPPKKKKVPEAPKGPSLFPQPCRPRPLASQLFKSNHVDSSAAGGGSSNPTGGRGPARTETPPRSPLHGDRIGTAGGDTGASHQSLLLPEAVCTVLATPLNDNELDVPSLTENRTVELRGSVEEYLRNSMALSVIATTTTSNGIATSSMAIGAGGADLSGASETPTTSRPVSAIRSKTGRPQSSPSVSRTVSTVRSSKTRASRFTVTDEGLLAMTVKDAIAAGLVPSPAVARAVQVAKASIIRQRLRAQRVTTPLSPSGGGGGTSTPSNASTFNKPQGAPSSVTRDDLLDAGISPAALALCDAYESASGVASRIASGVTTSAEANLVKLQAFYQKVHPNNLLRIHEEISRNMGINTAELAFVEQRLVADITKAVEGISKVVDTEIEATAANSNHTDTGDMGGVSNSVLGGSIMQLTPIRKQAGFVSFGGGGGGSGNIDVAQMSTSLGEHLSTSTMEGSMSVRGSPLQKATSIHHLEAFLSNGATTTAGSNANHHHNRNQAGTAASSTKIAIDTVARLCASTIGPALTERLPPVALLVLTLYCCSQQDVAHLFPSLEGQEAEALADMENALQERKREEGIMRAARRTSNTNGDSNNGKSPSKNNGGVSRTDGVLEEIKLLQLRRVLLERVKEAEKRKAHEYESGFRNVGASHGAGGGIDGGDPNGDGDGDAMIMNGEESMLSPSSPVSYLLSPGSTSGFRASQAEVARLEMESLHTPFYHESGQPRAVVTITRSLEELRLAVQTAGVTTVLGGRKGLPTTVPTTNNTDIILGKWAGTVTVLVAAVHTITTACEVASRAPPPRPTSGLKSSAISSPISTPIDATRLAARRRTTTIRASSPDYKGAPTFKPTKVNPASLPDPLGLPLGYYLQRAYAQVMAVLPTITTSSNTPPHRNSSVAFGMGARMSLVVDMSAGTPGGNALLSSGVISSTLLSASAAASPPRISPAATASAFAGGTSSVASINLSPFVSPGATTLAHLVAIVNCVTPSRHLNNTIKGWISTGGFGGGYNFGNNVAMPSSDATKKSTNPAAAAHPAASIPPEKDTLGNNLISSGYLPVRYRVLSSSPPAAMDYFRRASLEALRGTFMPPLLCPVTANSDVFSSSSTLPLQMEFAEPVPPVLFDGAVSEEERMHALFDGWHVSKQPTLEELEALLAADARGKQKAPSGKAGSVVTDSAILEMKIQAMTTAIANASAASGAEGGGAASTKKPIKKSKKSEGPLPMTPEEEEVYLSRIPSHVIIELWVRPDIHSVPMSLLFSSRPHEEEFLLSPLLRYRIKRIDIPNMTLQLLVDTSPRQDELDGSASVVTFFKDVMQDATKASNTARRLCDRLISEFVPKYHCHRHPSQKYAFFCRTCRLLICLGCAREQHAAHMVSSLPYFCHNEAVRMHPNIDSLMARVTRLREVISDLKPKVLSLTDVVDKGMLGVEERLRVHQASLHVDADARATQQLRQILNEKRRCLEEKANILRTKQALLLLQRGASKAVPKALVPQTYFQINCRLSLALPSGDISKLIKVLTWSNPSKYLSPLIYPPPEAKLHTLQAVDNALAYAAASGNSDEVITVTTTEAQAGGGDGSGVEETGGGARGVVTKRVPLTTTGSVAASLVPTGSIGIGDERNIRLTVAGISSRITELTRQAEEALAAVWADVTASAEMRGDIAKSDEILVNGAAEAFILVDEADD